MTTQLPSKERLAEIAAYEIGADNYPRRAEWQAMARALLAAYEQEPVHLIKIEDEPGRNRHLWLEVPATNWMAKAFYRHPAPSIHAVPDEIVGWVRDENGDSRDPLFLCGSVKPDMGKAYNSQYFPVKRAAMLNGGVL